MNRTALVDEIRNYLRDSIINLDIKPGEQLNESVLIDKLDVSRIPLREAFRLLEGEGFVTRKFGKGVYVRRITANDVLEIFPIRAVLEGLAAELATPRLTSGELRNLERITKKMKQLVKIKDIRGYLRLNFDFHRQIVKAACNSRLEALIKNAERQSTWLMFAAMYYRKSLDYAMSDHNDIYLALKKRNAKLAAKCIKEHINSATRQVLDYFPL